MMTKFTLASALFMASCASNLAVSPSVYPVIHPNRSVTFTFHVPADRDEDIDYDEVYIKGSFVKQKSVKAGFIKFHREAKVEMNEVEEGVSWTYTTPPLDSELYTYQFEVDDHLFVDPANPNRLRDVADTLSYFIIPGGIADDYIDHNVPHGSVKKVWYPSSLNGMSSRRMSIYLPAAYKSQSTKSFPVLYLLHGSGGDEEAWLDAGRLAQIMDNLIANHRCPPMIVVMPNGNIDLAAAPGADPNDPDRQPSAKNTNSMLGHFEAHFVDEIVAFVDKNYRSIPDKAHRAIAGLSLGGLHALYTSLNNPDCFDYVGLFSAQTTNALNDGRIKGLKNIGEAWDDLKNSFSFMGGGRVDRNISRITSDNLDIYKNLDDKLRIQFANPPKVYYIAVGTNDFVKKLNDDFRKTLDAAGYNYIYNETDGSHTWESWRQYLVAFLPLLFK